MNYWLMKSEPDCFSLADLKSRSRCTEHWDGVRNYQARNFLREMKKGDRAFFYHSSCAEPAIAGIVDIVKPGYPDHTAWDARSEHFDAKSSAEKPVWYMVDVRFHYQFENPITLATLKQHPALRDMKLLQRGNRLSVMPISHREWNSILKLSGENVR